MTSKIGTLSKLNLQDSTHNPLIGILCDVHISEAQRLLSETIDEFSKKSSFNEFFTRLSPTVRESPFNINVTEEEITITDSLSAVHVLKFADVTGSDKQDLIEESKSLIKKINTLYRACHDTSGTSHTSTSSTAGINPSRVSPIHTHFHDQQYPVSSAGAQPEPRGTPDPVVKSLSSDSQSDLATIHSTLNLLRAMKHAQELRQTGQLSDNEAQPTLSAEELAEIKAHNPSLAPNQRLNELIAAMGIRRPEDAPVLRAAPLLSSQDTYVPMPLRSTQLLQNYPQRLKNRPIITHQDVVPSIFRDLTIATSPTPIGPAELLEEHTPTLLTSGSVPILYPQTPTLLDSPHCIQMPTQLTDSTPQPSAATKKRTTPQPIEDRIATPEPIKVQRDPIDEILDLELSSDNEVKAIGDTFKAQLRSIARRHGFTTAEP